MNLFKISELFVAGTIAAIALAAIGTIVTGTYRGAGGAMGAERIQQRATLKATPFAQTANGSSLYERAGGPLGIERVAGVSNVKTYVTGPTATPVLCQHSRVALRFGS